MKNIKYALQIFEVILWIPLLVIGFIANLICCGLRGGWRMLDDLHNWMDLELNFKNINETDDKLSEIRRN